MEVKESKVGGRIAIYFPGHPGANNKGYILKSRFLMEQKIGRQLKSEEVVHHKNGNELDDRIENLELFASESDHQKEHWRTNRKRLDYKIIAELVKKGFGYKKIAKEIGESVNSVKSAVRTIKLGVN